MLLINGCRGFGVTIPDGGAPGRDSGSGSSRSDQWGWQGGGIREHGEAWGQNWVECREGVAAGSQHGEVMQMRVGRGACGGVQLPAEILLLILGLAARPLPTWLPQDRR